jgi:hypothetical protein
MCQFTVSVKVVVCVSDPEVAVTVTVDETGGGVDTALEAPLQPLSAVRPAALVVASSNSVSKRLRRFQPKQQKATANTEPGKSGLESRCSAAAVAAVVTVSVVEYESPSDVSKVGEVKLHAAPLGNPVQAKVTGELKPLKPPTSVAVMVAVPFCPP